MTDLLEHYRLMRRIRRMEETLMNLKDAGEIPGSIHLCNGQEAIPVGASLALDPGDYVTATYRGHGWAITRGTDLGGLIAELMGRDSTLCGGRAGSPFFSDASRNFLGENSIVGAGVPVAAGAALTAQRSRSGRVSVVSIGDGATNQGAVHEALNMAAVLSLPLIVIVENNVYSEMSRIEDMVRVRPLATRGAAYGIPAQTIDGNDVPEVRRAVSEAVECARSGNGPTIIEAMTERLVGHYSGDAQQYRPAGEVERARLKEPLARIRALVADDPFVSLLLDDIDRVVDQEIEAAVNCARVTAYPDPTTSREHLYA
jgi:TPP-dependent pyruvate/acetoin dehydrogenase alpha subunit